MSGKIAEIEEKDIKSILDNVKLTRGVDFNDYAQSSLRRRITRFFEINRIFNVAEFNAQIRNDDKFAEFFINEITVNVTEMFRDPSFWVFLRDKVFPDLIKRPVLKIWHAACSTGEEVYSMGILLKEAGFQNNIRIIATDLNQGALDQAKTGVYKKNNQKLNQKNYEMFGGKSALSEYYTENNNEVTYDPDLIKNVKFQNHNLVSNNSFSVFDLIICRNVLIYFNLGLQERVLHLFNNSLTPDSYLAIGSKESIDRTRAEKHFSTISFDEKIYKKI